MSIFDKDELRRRVDEVLYYVWDPIGVTNIPSPRGEYKSYVSKVLELVEQNADIKPISEHLAWIISIRMGLSPNKERCDSVAELLLDHKESISKGWA